jgi:Ca2+-binding RTX toxin-like protein
MPSALRTALLALVLLVAGAAPASAATVALDGTTVRVTAAPGEVNAMQVIPATGGVTIVDAVAPTAGDGCVLTAPDRVTCTATLTGVVADLGDGDDTLSVTAARAVTVTDGEGDDSVTGGAADDTFIASPGADTYAGAGGLDHVTYAGRVEPVRVTIGTVADDGAAAEGDAVGADVESLTGGAGADTLVGDASSTETLRGGDGGDRLDGGAGNDTLDGGAGDDSLDGGSGADVIDGGAGVDTADYSTRSSGVVVDLDNRADDGTGERDNVRTTIERILGGAGTDYLYGTTGAQTLAGNGGNDELRGYDGDDVLDGGLGNDRLRGAAGADTHTGGDGNDQAWGGDGDDLLDLGTGDDVGYGEGGADRLYGVAGTDAIDGGSGNDLLSGGDGDDTLSGSYGADTGDGGPGTDAVNGGNEPDQLAGGAGDDTVRGDAGNDRLVGGDGNDRLSGGGNEDSLDGGSGGDELWGDDGADVVDYSTRGAPLTVRIDDQAGDGEGGEGDNVHGSVEHVIGGAGADTLVGSGAANDLYGEGGNDVIDGAGGRDRLFGGSGDDRITGAADVDELDGGDGDDVFDAHDGLGEPIRCGGGRDYADTDGADRPDQCETIRTATVPQPRDPNPSTFDPPAPRTKIAGVRRRVGGGRFVPIPGFDGERIDRRLLADIAHLRQKYKIAITAGLAMHGHAAGGEHPIGLGLDIVPGKGGSWNDVDRLARWAEPRQNRPRSPFRWVGYNGDANHGRGHHLHLSWRHSPVRPGKAARVVWTLDLRKLRAPAVRSLTALARSNGRLGRRPSVRSGLKSPARCSGTAGLRPIWRSAAKAFGLRWQVLAGLTEIESAHGCNMGPSSAGAIGWTQFLPSTWRMYGMDASGDRKADPHNAVDAIYSTARYLRASGAPRSYRKALFAYNHAGWYVDKVLAASRRY